MLLQKDGTYIAISQPTMYLVNISTRHCRLLRYNSNVEPHAAIHGKFMGRIIKFVANRRFFR